MWVTLLSFNSAFSSFLLAPFSLYSAPSAIGWVVLVSGQSRMRSAGVSGVMEAGLGGGGDGCCSVSGFWSVWLEE